jgi:hypothetical protein
MTVIRPTRGANRRLIWARWVTEATSPAVLAGIIPVVVTVHASPAGAGWAAVAVLFVSALPLAVVLVGVRRGRWTDHHLRDRGQRRVPLLIAVTSLGVGGVILLVWQAPRDLLALVAAMGVGLLTVLVVTHWWKISVHSAVAAGTVTVLVSVFGLPLLVLAPVAGLSGWSRTVLDDHTPAQVLAGMLLGTAVAATVFPPLR